MIRHSREAAKPSAALKDRVTGGISEHTRLAVKLPERAAVFASAEGELSETERALGACADKFAFEVA
jgi:hypothetical protein